MLIENSTYVRKALDQIFPKLPCLALATSPFGKNGALKAIAPLPLCESKASYGSLSILYAVSPLASFSFSFSFFFFSCCFFLFFYSFCLHVFLVFVLLFLLFLFFGLFLGFSCFHC